MAETDLTPEEAAADARLPLYNVGDYDPVTNPYGFDNDGHQVNQMPQARDAGVMGRLARRLALFVQGLANTVAANVILTAEDAENTRLDRIATAENVVRAAEEVTKAAAQAERFQGTSATSHTPALAARNFTTQPGKLFNPGTYVTIVSTADANRWMFARVTAYNASTGLLQTNVEAIGSNATVAASWSITVSGARGAQGAQGIPGIATMPYLTRSANTQLVAGDSASLIDATGTFTQTFAAPGTLGANWYCFYKNAGTGNITIPASDGRTNWIMYPGEMRLFQCDGTTLRSEVLWPFAVRFLSSADFIKPPGYEFFDLIFLSGSGGGGGGYWDTSSATRGGGTGAGGLLKLGPRLKASELPNASPVSVAAAGVAGAASPSVGQAASAGGNGGATVFAGTSLEGGRGGSPGSGVGVGNGAAATVLSITSASDAGIVIPNLPGLAGQNSQTGVLSPQNANSSRLFGIDAKGGNGGGGRGSGSSGNGDPSTAGVSGALLIFGVL